MGDQMRLLASIILIVSTIATHRIELAAAELNSTHWDSPGSQVFTIVPEGEQGISCTGRAQCGSLGSFTNRRSDSGQSIFSRSHSLWVFQPGMHYLESDLIVEDAQNITLTGNAECELNNSLCNLVLKTTAQNIGSVLAMKTTQLRFQSSKGITISHLYVTTMILDLTEENTALCEAATQPFEKAVRFANVSDVFLHRVNFDFWDLGENELPLLNPYSIVIVSPQGIYRISMCTFQGVCIVNITINSSKPETHSQSSSFSLRMTNSSMTEFGQFAIRATAPSPNATTDILIQSCNFTNGKNLDYLDSLVLVEASETGTKLNLRISNSQFYANNVSHPVLAVGFPNTLTCVDNCSNSSNLRPAPVQISNCVFEDNIGGVNIAVTEPPSGAHECTKTPTILITNTIFTSNNITGYTFAARLLKPRRRPNPIASTVRESAPCPPRARFTNTSFVHNVHSAAAFTARSVDGIVAFENFLVEFTGQTRIVSNMGCGLQLSNTTLIVSGTTETTHNAGSLPNSCGGVHMDKDSTLVLTSNSMLNVSHNKAPILGGGIHISPNTPSLGQVRWERPAAAASRSNCFVIFSNSKENNYTSSFTQPKDVQNNVTFLAYRNYAQFGANMYSSYAYNCSDTIHSRGIDGGAVEGKIPALWKSSGAIRRWNSIASQPLHLCLCEPTGQSISNCDHRQQHFIHHKLYPGEKWQLFVTVLGIHGEILETDVYIAISSEMILLPTLVQARTQQCTAVLTVEPFNSQPVLSTGNGSNTHVYNITLTAPPMYPDSAIFHDNSFLKQSLTVNLTLNDCPPGMQLHRKANMTYCSCNALLQQHDFECSIANSVPKYKSRRQNYWVALREDENLILSDYCPSDYCTDALHTEGVTLSELATAGNKQCTAKHYGFLCSNEAGCDHRLYAQTVVVLLCGIVISAVLLFLNVTIRSGTLNGFSMYANVLILLTRYRVLAPLAGVASFMNLEFNIGMCLASSNSSEYVDKWLVFQVSFPLCCVFGVEILIILLFLASHWCCRKKVSFTTFLKDRAVPFLALIVLLTFTNVLRTIIGVFSNTAVYTDTSDYTVRWISVPQLVYFTRGHLGVAVFSIVLAVTYIAPFILLMTTADCLKLLVTFKFLCNAFRGPFQGIFGFWLGMRVILRVILTLIGYFTNENTFAMIVFLSLVFSIFLQLLVQPFRNPINLDEPHKITHTTNCCSPLDVLRDLVRKFFYPQTLDHLFLLNMIIATIPIIVHAEPTTVLLVFSMSVGLALVQLLAILAFHCHKRIAAIRKDCKQRRERVESLRLSHVAASAEEDNIVEETVMTNVHVESNHGNTNSQLGSPLLTREPPQS